MVVVDFSYALQKRGLGFCVSAAHTREMLDTVSAQWPSRSSGMGPRSLSALLYRACLGFPGISLGWCKETTPITLTTLKKRGVPAMHNNVINSAERKDNQPREDLSQVAVSVSQQRLTEKFSDVCSWLFLKCWC